MRGELISRLDPVCLDQNIDLIDRMAGDGSLATLADAPERFAL
jgi:hypothetical protein